MGQDKFAAGVVLEGLCPRQIAVDIMNDHDVFVAKAGDLWEMTRLIGVHCLLKFVDANNISLLLSCGGREGVSGNTLSGFFLVEFTPCH
jgi:hypothetical protein